MFTELCEHRLLGLSRRYVSVLSVDPAFQPLAEHSAPRCSAQASALAIHDPNLFAGPTNSTDSTANRLGLAGGATRGLCCGHLGRSSGASQRLGRASFTHAATTGMRGPGVEPWCELHARGGYGHSRFTRWTSKLPSACCRGESPRPLQRSRVQWRARGYLGHQVVVLAHSEQGCALVGFCA